MTFDPAITLGELLGSARTGRMGQCGLIYWGLCQMSRASEIRSRWISRARHLTRWGEV